MTQANSTLVASAAVIALTLGVTGQTTAPRDAPPLSSSDITVAADDTAPAAGQTEESAEDSAKMGKEEGTHEGDNLGATPEDDTAKIDQPARRNPTTGNTGDTNGSQQ
jgi:hypothetical protein